MSCYSWHSLTSIKVSSYIVTDSSHTWIWQLIYLRSRQTGMVGTSSLTKLPNDLEYLARNMHPLTWAYKWFNCKAKFTYHPRAGEGPDQELHAEEPVCLLIWMDKKYRSEDKKVVFITNCIPAIPETPKNQCHMKNIRHANHQYTRQLIASPPPPPFSRRTTTEWAELINTIA